MSAEDVGHVVAALKLAEKYVAKGAAEGAYVGLMRRS